MACRDDRCDDSTSFDKDLTRSHNDAMVRRLLALALSAIFVLLSTSAWAQCTGWDSTRAGRHACCAHAGHETTEQGAAACCAGVEQSRHGTVAAHAFHMPPLVALAHVAPVPALAIAPSRVLLPSIDPVALDTSPPLFLRYSSFLI